MRRPPRRSFIEFERRPDFDGELAGRRREAPRPAPASQRGYKITTRAYPVGSTSEELVSNWKRVNGPIASVQKGKLEASRVSQAISAALAKRKAQAANDASARRAKPSGADRRQFTFTSGPKTFYGTFARIVPKAGGRFRFVLPAHVVPCVQRKTRREVLFAKGFGGHSSGRRKYGPNSHIGC